jgi:ketosteroid isomerase-like protein
MRPVRPLMLTLFLIATLPALAQRKPGVQPLPELPMSEEQRINQRISAMLAALQVGDWAQLKSFYDDAVTAVSAFDQPVLQGWPALAAALAAQRQRIQSGQILRRNTFVRVHGDVAWAAYQWEFIGIVDGQPADLHGHTTLIWLREHGQWRIVHEHSSTALSTGGAAGPAQPDIRP